MPPSDPCGLAVFYSSSQRSMLTLASQNNGADLLASVLNYMDAQELEKAIHSTRRGQREVVMLDFNPGGRAYGYSSEPVKTDGKQRWRIVVAPEQARIVREIFQRYADGEGLKAIAEDLNSRGVPSPSGCARLRRKRLG